VFKAKRLVSEELATIWIHLDGLVDRGTALLPGEERRLLFMPTRAWDTHKGTVAEKGGVLKASKLADRGWGKAPAYAAIEEEEDPLDLANLERAAQEFRASILRLAADSQSDTELRS
jgi:hypothetical protein